MASGKGLIRSLNRRGVRSNMSPPAKLETQRLKEPSVCERCGAVYERSVWRHRRLNTAALEKVAWVTCPACAQVREGDRYFGRVLIRGPYAVANADVIRRRVQNVGRRSAYTQPQRRIMSIDSNGKTIEVLTTSQKLAHRIARELEKAFGGKATFKWSDRDGTLLTTWRKETQ